jgi:hypothetical protein
MTKKDKKLENIKRKEISQQLKLTYLRDNLLDLSLIFLISPHDYFEESDPKRKSVL